MWSFLRWCECQISVFHILDKFFKDSMTQKLEKLKEVTQSDLSHLKDESEEVSAEMDSLKRKLYGKFGNSINLETDKED